MANTVTVSKDTNKILVSKQKNKIEITTQANKVFVTKENETKIVNVNVLQNKVTVLEQGPTVTVIQPFNKIIVQSPGTQGPIGPPGNVANVINTYIAGEIISIGSAVKLETDGFLYNSDKDVQNDLWKTIGVSIGSGTIGASIQVLEKGFYQNSIFNSFSPGSVFVGNGGALVQTPPSAGFCKNLGFIPKAGEIYVELAQAVILNN